MNSAWHSAAKPSIRVAAGSDGELVAKLIADLLEEIMAQTDQSSFQIDRGSMMLRAKALIETGKSTVLLAEDQQIHAPLGLIAISECHAVYAGGSFGVITELFVTPSARSRRTGESLLRAAEEFGRSNGWTRLEVTTPPLPQFERTLAFYERFGFEITGGRKLKRLVPYGPSQA